MKITFDPAKRETALSNRGLDFADANEVFAGLHATLPDDRQDYGEPRFISAGMQAGLWWWFGRRVATHGALSR